jgi:hypothetical protein
MVLRYPICDERRDVARSAEKRGGGLERVNSPRAGKLAKPLYKCGPGKVGKWERGRPTRRAGSDLIRNYVGDAWEWPL